MSSLAAEVEPLRDAHWAAEFLGIGLNTLYIKARADEVPHYRIGATLRFRQSDLERWLDGRRRGAEVGAA